MTENVHHNQAAPAVDSKAVLESLLKSHDWTYMMSDDPRAYEAGRQEAGRIKRLVAQLGAEGQAMYDKAKARHRM